MNLANPIMLWWAALAVPIVIFYILKIRMRRVPVSTVMFWQQVFEEKQPRSIWQKLRHLLSLLLQLAFLALLVLALTDPYFEWEVLAARRMVLVVDNSASMRAADVEPTRLAAAKNAAYKLIESLRTRDELAIISAGTQPKVLCGLTSHQRTLREIIDRIPETDGPTHVREAVAIARKILAGQPNTKVIVLSDGGFDDIEELTKADDVQLNRIGTRTDNVALTQFQVRRSLLDPIGYQILTEVKNLSDKPAELRLEIELGPQIVDVVPLSLEPQETWTQVFEKTSAEGGRLRARLDQADALAADNEAWAILPRRERQQVVLVTEGNLFLQKVFEANPLVDLAVTETAPAAVSPETVLVLHRKVPANVPTGRVIVIDPQDSTDLWDLGEPLEQPAVAKQDKDSPLMAHVRLDNVLMPEARQVKLKDKATVLVESLTGDPLYFSLDQPERKAVVLTVNLDRGDLPLRTAFPILMTNALGWMAGTKGELRESLATGTVTEIALPESLVKLQDSGTDVPRGNGENRRWDADATAETSATDSLLLVAPDGAGRSLPLSGDRVTIGPLDQTGVWQIRTRSSADNPTPEVLDIACNLTNQAESNLQSFDETNETVKPLAAGFGGKPIWFYLLVVAWLLAGTEWFLYQRRWIS